MNTEWAHCHFCYILFAKAKPMAKSKVRGNKIYCIHVEGGATRSCGKGQTHWKRWSIGFYYSPNHLQLEREDRHCLTPVQEVETCISWVTIVGSYNPSGKKNSISRGVRNPQTTAVEFVTLKEGLRHLLCYSRDLEGCDTILGKWSFQHPHLRHYPRLFFLYWMRKEV